MPVLVCIIKKYHIEVRYPVHQLLNAIYPSSINGYMYIRVSLLNLYRFIPDFQNSGIRAREYELPGFSLISPAKGGHFAFILEKLNDSLLFSEWVNGLEEPEVSLNKVDSVDDDLPF